MGGNKQSITIRDGEKEMSASVEHSLIPSANELKDIQISLGNKYVDKIFKLAQQEQKHRHKTEQKKQKEENLNQNKDYYALITGKFLLTFCLLLSFLFGIFLIYKEWYGWGITSFFVGFFATAGSLNSERKNTKNN